MNEKYAIRDEPGKMMFVFFKNNQYYGHIVKERTDKSPAKIVFETKKYDSLSQLKSDYPPLESSE
ncbi:hypothetical protein [Paenibacillus eucommiae]|uniref:Phage protein n=1 Tax=Paenibacillus eucommiae TaxID=1355755 RepID=A0ABS4IYR8_9BACL|nr:hypothetical protein [Paenibacillus eucommiae]MBP1992732.1 hypothetical protein [Paenibacillus eucommiae]